jgi:K+ transporter
MEQDLITNVLVLVLAGLILVVLFKIAKSIARIISLLFIVFVLYWFVTQEGSVETKLKKSVELVKNIDNKVRSVLSKSE